MGDATVGRMVRQIPVGRVSEDLKPVLTCPCPEGQSPRGFGNLKTRNQRRCDNASTESEAREDEIRSRMSNARRSPASAHSRSDADVVPSHQWLTFTSTKHPRNAGFILGTWASFQDDPSDQIRNALVRTGLRPGIDEFKVAPEWT